MIEFARTAQEKARKNLETVVKALGAQMELAPMKIFFRHGPYTYQIDVAYIYRWQHGQSGKEFLDAGVQTCYQSLPVPDDEKIATVLLQINRDPKYFENLRRKDGYYV